ncbi:MAG: hypothetical protein QOF71_1226 [Candidatus Eremiobacteraeota bacterium]|jgi:hypothetical protein|nr:hypothetical protein [Candidatus Eremiobacteraeota bacterium]
MSDSVTDLATRRRTDDVLNTISFVFGGVHYGTIPIATPYVKGKPIVLYIVPQSRTCTGEGFAGPLDCLVTDDVALAAELDVAR